MLSNFLFQVVTTTDFQCSRLCLQARLAEPSLSSPISCRMQKVFRPEGQPPTSSSTHTANQQPCYWLKKRYFHSTSQKTQCQFCFFKHQHFKLLLVFSFPQFLILQLRLHHHFSRLCEGQYPDREEWQTNKQIEWDENWSMNTVLMSSIGIFFYQWVFTCMTLLTHPYADLGEYLQGWNMRIFQI